MLAACRGIIEEDRYQDFYKQCESQGPHRWLESFFEFLAGLTLGKQEKCFDAIVCTLRSEGKYNHIIQRLQKGISDEAWKNPPKSLLIIAEVASVKHLRGTCTRNFCVYFILSSVIC